MSFPRVRLLNHITMIVLRVLAIIALVVGLLAGILVAIATKSFLFFAIFFFSCALLALILFLVIRLLKWLEKDYEELDSEIRELKKIPEIIKKDNEKMTFVIEHVDTAVSKGKQVIEKTPENEPQPESQPDEPHPEEPKEDKPVEVVVLSKSSIKLIEKGAPIQITKDFEDYGFSFKKGMKGIADSSPDKDGIVSVRMTDKIKGFFRISVDCIETI